METNKYKYLIPINTVIETGEYYNDYGELISGEIVHYYLTESDQNFEYITFIEDGMSMPLYQYFQEHKDQLVEQDGNYYLATDSMPYMQSSNMSLDYYLYEGEYITPTSSEIKNLQEELDKVKSELSATQEKNLEYKNYIVDLEEKLDGLQQIVDVSNLVNNVSHSKCTDIVFVDTLRISADGEYLEVDINCDDRYEFVHIAIYPYNDKNKLFDISDDIDKDSNRQMFRVKLSDLDGNTMYYISVQIQLKNGPYYDILDSNEDGYYEFAVSDVSNVYYYLLSQLVGMLEPCNPCDLNIPVDVQRAFIILYAHMEAMRLHRYSEAEMFYTIIKNNFSHCFNDSKLTAKRCNCYGKVR